MGPQELSTLLWRERELLEMLLFKLEEEQLLLTAGRTRWLAHANREVETVMEKVREATLVRTVASETVAAEWGLAPDATLREIAAAAPAAGPWREIFEGHLTGLPELTLRDKTLRAPNTHYCPPATPAPTRPPRSPPRRAPPTPDAPPPPRRTG